MLGIKGFIHRRNTLARNRNCFRLRIFSYQNYNCCRPQMQNKIGRSNGKQDNWEKVDLHRTTLCIDRDL